MTFTQIAFSMINCSLILISIALISYFSELIYVVSFQTSKTIIIVLFPHSLFLVNHKPIDSFSKVRVPQLSISILLSPHF